jgi:hypothetical protein
MADIPMDSPRGWELIRPPQNRRRDRQSQRLWAACRPTPMNRQGARSLPGALGDHPSNLIEGGVNLDQVDAMTARTWSATSSGPIKIKLCRPWVAIFLDAKLAS